MNATPLALIALACTGAFAFAESPPDPAQTDKSGYTLFNPTPDSMLRDFDTDRPDKTNSPHTVDAGHFQIEADLLAFTHTKDGALRSENWTWANANLRIGLTNWADLQLLIPFHESNREKDSSTHSTDRASGIGDLGVVLKTNLWGDDSDSAGGLEVFVKTPTASHGLGNGKVEGGVIFLVDTKPPGDFDFGFNSGVTRGADDLQPFLGVSYRF
jgi:hypothetical protein